MNTKKIPVTIVKWKLTDKELNKLVRNGAINLSGRTPIDTKIKWGAFLSSSLLIFLIMVWIYQVNASSTLEMNFDSEFEQLLLDDNVKQEDIDGLVDIIDDVYNTWTTVNSKQEDVYNRAFEVIAKFEWYRDEPYWDNKQWSCWYGMKCSKDTKWITKEKSKQFTMERIQKIRDRYDLYKYDDNIEVALLSFIYNTWHPPVWMDWYIENWHINALKNMMRKYIYSNWEVMEWLKKRREYETWLF